MIENGYNIQKFALVGPQSVGKTTTTDILRDCFVDDPRVLEMKRYLIKKYQAHYQKGSTK